MFDLVYSVFFMILLLEVGLFLFMNLPTPKGWKGKIVKFLNTNKSIKTIMKVHLGCCLLSAIFFMDCYKKENRLQQQKDSAKKGDSLAAEYRYKSLSFRILRIQRNKYITFMLIYASLALNAYIWLLNYMYEKREAIEQQSKVQSGAQSAPKASLQTAKPV